MRSNTDVGSKGLAHSCRSSSPLCLLTFVLVCAMYAGGYPTAEVLTLVENKIVRQHVVNFCTASTKDNIHN